MLARAAGCAGRTQDGSSGAREVTPIKPIVVRIAEPLSHRSAVDQFALATAVVGAVHRNAERAVTG